MDLRAGELREAFMAKREVRCVSHQLLSSWQESLVHSKKWGLNIKNSGTPGSVVHLPSAQVMQDPGSWD